MTRKLFYQISIVPLLAGVVACSEKSAPENSVGQQVFQGTCKVCHAGGINGAPIFGNKKMWEKRLPQGIDTLVSHAINGYGLMPAKGGNTSLTDEQISHAVNYMVQHVKQP